MAYYPHSRENPKFRGRDVVLNMQVKNPLKTSQKLSVAFLKIAHKRSNYFGRYNERFDRRLYAEQESLVRLWHALGDIGISVGDSNEYRQLLTIQRLMLDKASELGYDQFP